MHSTVSPENSTAQPSIRITLGLNPALRLALLALSLTIAICFFLVHLERQYFSHYPFLVDASYYSWQAIFDSFRLTQSSRLYVAFTEFLWNDRFALRVVPLILFAPKLLLSPVGHIATALPSLFLFLVLLGTTTYSKTKSYLFSVTLMLFFSSMPWLYEPRYGLGGFWLESVGVLFFGSTIICALQYMQSEKPIWLYALAGIAGLSAMSRYLSIAYIIFTCAPLLIASIVSKMKILTERKFLFQSIAIAFALFVISGGWYVLLHIQSNMFYYTNWGIDANKGALYSAHFVIPWFINAVGKPHMVALLILGALRIYYAAKEKSTINLINLLASIWLATGILFLVIVVLHLSTGCHPTMYAIPAFFLALVCPGLPGKTEKVKKSVIVFTSAALVAVSVGETIHFVGSSEQKINHPAPNYSYMKTFDLQVAEYLSSLKSPFLWMSFVDCNAYDISCQTFYSHHIIAHTPPLNFIYFCPLNWFRPQKSNLIHASGARLTAINDACDRWIDYLVVFDQPIAPADKRPWLVSQAARDEAASVALYVKSHSNWVKEREIISPLYGKVACYHNLNSGENGFKAMMRGDNIFPQFKEEAK